MKTIYLDPKVIPLHLKGPYNGEMFKALVVTEITIPSRAGLWDSGSRDSYSIIDLATGRTVPGSDNHSSPWNAARKDRPVILEPGFAVVRHSVFRGKDMGLTFYIHPKNTVGLIPAPSAPLSINERWVLNATCQFKASHNGQDRYQMSGATITRDEWNQAKASLIAKGLLDKRGSVTIKGRNARTD